ncbi:hypothetical protein ACOSQ3_029422 [Xanthoceras sorbifolium]
MTVKIDMATKNSGHHGTNRPRGTRFEILIDEEEEEQVGDKRQFGPRAKANVGRILSEIFNNLDDKISKKNIKPKGMNSSFTSTTKSSKKGRNTFNKPFTDDTKKENYKVYKNSRKGKQVMCRDHKKQHSTEMKDDLDDSAVLHILHQR